MQIMAR